MREEHLKVVFFHPDEYVYRFLTRFVRNYYCMSAFCGDLKAVIRESSDMDFIVTAGNSFGLMDGGLDKAVADEFPGIELCVRDRISSVYGAQMPVGTAENFFWEKGKVRSIIYAPTMQVPMDINGTDNVYLATMAAVHTAVNRTGRVNRTIWMPMMGTGTGRMPLDAAMRQMARGVKDGLWKWKAEDMTWSHAQEMHERWHEMTGIPDMIPKTYGGDEQS